jgi:hypothetical protein
MILRPSSSSADASVARVFLVSRLPRSAPLMPEQPLRATIRPHSRADKLTRFVFYSDSPVCVRAAREDSVGSATNWLDRAMRVSPIGEIRPRAPLAHPARNPGSGVQTPHTRGRDQPSTRGRDPGRLSAGLALVCPTMAEQY